MLEILEHIRKDIEKLDFRAVFALLYTGRPRCKLLSKRSAGSALVFRRHIARTDRPVDLRYIDEQFSGTLLLGLFGDNNLRHFAFDLHQVRFEKTAARFWARIFDRKRFLEIVRRDNALYASADISDVNDRGFFRKVSVFENV